MTAPWIPCAVLFLWRQKGYIWTGEGSGKGHKDDQRCGSASPPGITKQNRLEMKWNDGVGVGQRSINHTRVSGGSKLGTMGALYPQGRNRGTEWREEAAGGKQRTGRGSSHNVLLNSAALRLRMLWIPVVSENSQPNSQNKGLQGTAAFYRRNFQLRGGWAPNSWLAESTPGKYCSLSPVLILLGHPWLTNTREKDPRLDGCLVWPALPFLHSYL